MVLATAICSQHGIYRMQQKEDTYPSDSIQIVVPVKAGGDTDANARLLTKYMEKELGVAMPVVNVSGSSGTIGMEQVRSAEPDGYNALFFHTEAMLPEIAELVDYQLDALKWLVCACRRTQRFL